MSIVIQIAHTYTTKHTAHTEQSSNRQNVTNHKPLSTVMMQWHSMALTDNKAKKITKSYITTRAEEHTYAQHETRCMESPDIITQNKQKSSLVTHYDLRPRNGMGLILRKQISKKVSK